jgi:hypothetical protein
MSVVLDIPPPPVAPKKPRRIIVPTYLGPSTTPPPPPPLPVAKEVELLEKQTKLLGVSLVMAITSGKAKESDFAARVKFLNQAFPGSNWTVDKLIAETGVKTTTEFEPRMKSVISKWEEYAQKEEEEQKRSRSRRKRSRQARKSSKSRTRRRKKSSKSRSRSGHSKKSSKSRSRSRKARRSQSKSRSRKPRKSRSRSRSRKRTGQMSPKRSKGANTGYTYQDNLSYLRQQTVIKLRAYAKARGLRRYSALRKEDLIKFILDNIDVDTGKLK